MSERATTEQPSRLPSLWVLLRDVGSFLAGWALIFMEVQRADIRESVLAFAGTVISTPGLVVGANQVGAALRRRGGTGSSPSEPADSQSSQSS